MPDKTCDEFSPIDYDCLVLLVAEIRMALRNQKQRIFYQFLEETYSNF